MIIFLIRDRQRPPFAKLSLDRVLLTSCYPTTILRKWWSFDHNHHNHDYRDNVDEDVLMLILTFFAPLDYHSDDIDGNYVICLPRWAKPDIDYSFVFFLTNIILIS